jgi:hypothetical protein
MFLKFKLFISYFVMTTAVAIVKKLPAFKKASVGGVNFYAAENIVHEFEKAIRVELPKYDRKLSELISSKDMKIDIFYCNSVYVFKPDAGIFFAPKWIFDYGSEGICQHIVFCIIGSKHTGIGFRAAMRVVDRKKMYAICKEKMALWIKEKKFPEHWLASYEPKNSADAEGKQPRK